MSSKKNQKFYFFCVITSLGITKICENKKIMRFHGYEQNSGINCSFRTQNRRKMLNKHNINKNSYESSVQIT